MTALGLTLLLVGVIVVAVEAHLPAHGALAVPGAVVLGAGAVLAVGGLGGGLLLGLLAALTLVVVAAGIVGVSLVKGAAARRRRIRSGPEAMIDRLAVVSSWSGQSGKVRVDGGLWRARLESEPGADDAPERPAGEPPEPRAGEQVVIEYVSGLTLAVRRAEAWELVRW